MQDNTLLTVCTKKLLLTQSLLLPTVDTKFFLKKSGRDDSHGVYQKASIKTELFILLTMDTTFFTEMQDNTLLTVCSERLLLKPSFFDTQCGYNFVLKKSRTKRFSRCVQKNVYKKLSCLFYSHWIQFFSNQMQQNTLLKVCSGELLLKLICFLLLTVNTKLF